MLIKWTYALSLSILISNLLTGQCDYAFKAVDEFDGTLTIAAHTVDVGYMIPSNFETVNGIRIIQQGKVLVSFTEEARDTGIISLFLTLAVQEYDYLPIENGETVLLALSDSTVVGLYNVPTSDFDRTTNMRLYTHTCPLPMDIFYKLIYHNITKVRILYRTQKKDIDILPDQQKLIQEQIKCIATEAGFLPLKP